MKEFLGQDRRALQALDHTWDMKIDPCGSSGLEQCRHKKDSSCEVSPQKNRGVKPSPLPKPPPRGTPERNLTDAPCGAWPRTASDVSRAEAQVGGFSGSSSCLTLCWSQLLSFRAISKYWKTSETVPHFTKSRFRQASKKFTDADTMRKKPIR